MIHTGDCLDVMRTLPESSVDAVVTDPPYGLEFMGKGWDKFKAGANYAGIVNDKSSVQLRHSVYSGGPNPTCRKCGGLQSLNAEGSGGRIKCRCVLPDFPNYSIPKMHAYQAWCEAWGREALRVTVPGGYLLAFGGTRTHHRLVCGLEDAGWIIRDELDWIYACLSDDTEILTRRGWLQYHEVSTDDDALAFDPATGTLVWQGIQAVHRYHHEGEMVRLHGAGTDQLVTLNHRLVLVDGQGVAAVPGVPGNVLAMVKSPSEVRRSSLLDPMQRDTALARPAVQDRDSVGLEARELGVCLSEDERTEQPSLEGRRYRVQEARELLGSALRASAGVGEADGAQGRLRHGAPPTDGGHVRLPDDQGRGGQSREPRSDGQPARELDALALEPGPQAVRVEPAGDAWRLVPTAVTASVVGYAGVVWCVTVPSGAFVARRRGLAFVTGNSGFPKGKANLKPAHEPIVLARKPGPLRMLNIDGCRIPTDDALSQHGRSAESDAGQPVFNPFGSVAAGQQPGQELGRWPANVILTDPVFDGGVDGVVGGGEARAAGEYPSEAMPPSMWRDIQQGQLYSDSGTYSRFFLVPKSSRSDREPAIPPEWYEDGKRSNSHPTCKPIELMRHLVRLVTPPGGTVLDPFLGSGTTAIACEMEGFAWIGIEKEAEYVAIAEARLNGVQRGLGLPA